MSLSKHFSKASNPSYIFGLGLTQPEFYFSQDKPGHFKVVSKAGKKAKHSWGHEDGSEGTVSSKHLVKNWQNYTSSDPVYGSALGVDGESHLLFEYKNIKLNKKGNLVAYGELHDHEFIDVNNELLKVAHGGSSIANHVKHDINNEARWLAQSDKDQSDAKSERRLDPDDGVSGGRGPLEWGFGPIHIPDPFPAPSPSPIPPVPIPSPIPPVPAPVNPLPAPVNPIPVPINPIPDPPKQWINNITDIGGGFTATTSAAWISVKAAVDKFVNNASATSLPFSYTWSVPDLEKSVGPINANLSITPTLKGSIDFGGGLTAAVAAKSYVPDIRSTLTADVNGSITAGKFSGTKPLNISGPSAEAKTDFGSLGVETGIHTLLTAATKDGDEITGQLFSMNAGFSPSATLNIIDGDFQPSFHAPTPTVDITGFRTNAQDFDSIITTITPYVKASGGVNLPEDIPFIGGDSVASIDFGINNSIVLNSSTTQGISNTVEGNLTADVSFMGSSLVDKTIKMYGPLSV